MNMEHTVCTGFIFEFTKTIQAYYYSLLLLSRCTHSQPTYRCEKCRDDVELTSFSYSIERASRTDTDHHRGLFLTLIENQLRTLMQSSTCQFDNETREVFVIRKPEQLSATVLVFCSAIEAHILNAAVMKFMKEMFHVYGNEHPKLLAFTIRDGRDWAESQIVNNRLIQKDDLRDDPNFVDLVTPNPDHEVPARRVVINPFQQAMDA